MASVDPAELFQGYDTFASSGRNTVVTGTQSAAQDANTHSYRVCTSIEDVHQALSISASVSGMFDLDSGSAKSSYVSTLNLTTTSVTIVVYASLASQVTATAWTPISNPATTLQKFYAGNGDSWVNQITKGAEYFATYTFYSQSVDEQKSVQGSLTAAGLDGGGLLSVNVQTAISKAKQSIQTRTASNQKLLGYSATKVIQPTDPDGSDIVGFATDLANGKFGAPDAPVTISWTTSGYEHAGIDPAVFQPIVDTRNLFAPDFGAGWADTYATLRAVSNLISNVQDVYQTYGYTNDPTMATNAGLINGDIATLNTFFTGIKTDPTIAWKNNQPTMRSATLGGNICPNLNAPLLSTTAVGGVSNAWTCEGLVSRQSQIFSLAIYGIHHIHGLGYSYQYSDGKTAGFLHGHNDSNDTLFLLPVTTNDPVITAYVHSSQDFDRKGDPILIDQIALTTAHGNSYSALGAPPAGYTPTWTKGTDEAFMGFSGMADNGNPGGVTTLQVVYVKFSPATWGPPPRRSSATKATPQRQARRSDSRGGPQPAA